MSHVLLYDKYMLLCVLSCCMLSHSRGFVCCCCCCTQEFPEEQRDVTQWCRHLAGRVRSADTLWAVMASKTAYSCDGCPHTAAAMVVDYFSNQKVGDWDRLAAAS